MENDKSVIFAELKRLKETEPVYFPSEQEQKEDEEIRQLRQILEEVQQPSWTLYTST